MIQYEPGMTVDSAEREIIEQAMRFYHGNKTQVAASIGIAPRTLDNKLGLYEKLRNERGLVEVKLEGERAAFLERARGYAPSGYANERPRMEPAAQIPTQQSMPMSEQKEVQKVLSENTSQSSRKKTG